MCFIIVVSTHASTRYIRSHCSRSSSSTPELTWARSILVELKCRKTETASSMKTKSKLRVLTRHSESRHTTMRAPVSGAPPLTAA